MKKNTLYLLIIAWSGLFLLAGCKHQAPRIGILMHSYENSRWTKDRDYLVEELKKRGADVMLKVADNDQKKQIEQGGEMINSGAKVLIVVSIDQNEAARIVELAHQSEVKVIAYDRLISGCKLDYYITTNSTHVGEMQASYLTSLRPKGRYALICGSRYDDNSTKLFVGQMNILQPLMQNGDIQLVYSEFTDEWSPAQGALHARRIFEQNDDSIAAIITGSDAIADGVLQVLKEKGLEKRVLIAGQDAEPDNLEAIVSGVQTCDILKPLKEMASVTAELAVAIALGKPVDMKFTSQSNGKALVKSILLDGRLIHKNNIESTAISGGFQSADQMKH